MIVFTDGNIAMAPAGRGVYTLYHNGVVCYFGSATEGAIRERLQSHKRGGEGPCTKAATHFTYELHANPKLREQQLLTAFRQAYNRLPECNEVGKVA